MAKVGVRTWHAVVRAAADGLPVVTSTGEALARDGTAVTSTDLARLIASRVRLVVMRQGVPNAIDDVQGLADCLVVRLVPISVLSERSSVSSRPADAVRSRDEMTP